MKIRTTIILLISHILIGLFTVWGTLLERALLARPDLPESTFWYYHVLIGASRIILFVLPFLLFLNLRWYRFIGLLSYLAISLFWYSVGSSVFNNLLLHIEAGELMAFFNWTTLFYILCLAFYIYPIVIFIKSLNSKFMRITKNLNSEN